MELDNIICSQHLLSYRSARRRAVTVSQGQLRQLAILPALSPNRCRIKSLLFEFGVVCGSLTGSFRGCRRDDISDFSGSETWQCAAAKAWYYEITAWATVT